MTKLVCVKCQTEYSSALGEIGVIVVEMAYNPPVPYKIWGADLLKCPGCGVEVVSGFSDRPIARDSAATVLLADTLRIGKARIVYDYERPVNVAQEGANIAAADIILSWFESKPFPSRETIARIIAAHRPPADPALQDTCQKLIAYRDQAGALNFQLEKADDFINLMRAGLDEQPTNPAQAHMPDTEGLLEKLTEGYIRPVLAMMQSDQDAHLRPMARAKIGYAMQSMMNALETLDIALAAHRKAAVPKETSR